MAIPAIAAMLGRAGGFGMASTYGVQATASSSLAKQGANALLDLPKSIARDTPAATRQTKALTNSFEQFRNTARKVAVDTFIAKNALAGLSGKATAALTAPLDMMAQAAAPLLGLVSRANPASAERFTRALEDGYGVIGRMLTPALDAATRLTRRLGDAYAKMEPVLKPTINAVTKLAEGLGNRLLTEVEKSGPLIAGVATSFELLVSALMPVKPAIDILIEAFRLSTGILQGIGRLSGRKANPDGSGVGAAVRNVSIGTSAESISRDAQAKALQQALGTGEKVDPQVSLLESIYQWISTKIPNKEDIPGLILDLATGIVKAGEMAAREKGNKAGNAALDMNFGLYNMFKSFLTR